MNLLDTWNWLDAIAELKAPDRLYEGYHAAGVGAQAHTQIMEFGIISLNSCYFWYVYKQCIPGSPFHPSVLKVVTRK